MKKAQLLERLEQLEQRVQQLERELALRKLQPAHAPWWTTPDWRPLEVTCSPP